MILKIMKSKILIPKNINIKKSFQILNKTAKKTLIVVNKKNRLLGTLSNGDLRKALLRGKKLNSNIEKIFKKNCVRFYENKIPVKSKVKKYFLEKGLDLIPVIKSNGEIIKIIYPNTPFRSFLKNKKKIRFYSVVMAGGLGTRLQPFTHILPKPLIPIKKKPVIEHIINKIQYYNPLNIFVTVNFKSKILKAFFDELKPRLKVNLIFENKPLGTCGVIKKIKFRDNVPILLLNCDTLVNFNIQKAIQTHIKNKSDMSVIVTKKFFKMPYGVCEIDEEKNLKKIVEKPNYKFSINTGIYVINKQILKNIPLNKKFDTTDLINKLKILKKKVRVFEISDKSWKDVGEWKNYLNN
tara:strand:+ start:292 stop:1347 length:1056 start_codon:yes stop_codon:yes gene_type:complete